MYDECAARRWLARWLFQRGKGAPEEPALTPSDPVFDEGTTIYHRGAGKYRNALRELAK